MPHRRQVADPDDSRILEDHDPAPDEGGRRWYHIRPKPRRRSDIWGFNSTWWMALGWPLLIVVALFPFPWWW